MLERQGPDPGWSDRRLVAACVKGDEAAWGALVDKYKGYVYAIIGRYGARGEAAADLFQGVWLDTYNDLAGLSEAEAFKGWIGTLTARKCFHWKQKRLRRGEDRGPDPSILEEDLLVVEGDDLVEELARDQIVREAVFQLPERCRKLVEMLFFAMPPKPYQEVAESLGLALGSIGFIRGRCLKKLKANLEELGW